MVYLAELKVHITDRLKIVRIYARSEPHEHSALTTTPQKMWSLHIYHLILDATSCDTLIYLLVLHSSIDHLTPFPPFCQTSSLWCLSRTAVESVFHLMCDMGQLSTTAGRDCLLGRQICWVINSRMHTVSHDELLTVLPTIMYITCEMLNNYHDWIAWSI